MNRWDAAVERLVQTGATQEGDEEILYLNFKLTNCVELSDHAAKARRSPPASKVHSDKLMYRVAMTRSEGVDEQCARVDPVNCQWNHLQHAGR